MSKRPRVDPSSTEEKDKQHISTRDMIKTLIKYMSDVIKETPYNYKDYFRLITSYYLDNKMGGDQASNISVNLCYNIFLDFSDISNAKKIVYETQYKPSKKNDVIIEFSYILNNYCRKYNSFINGKNIILKKIKEIKNIGYTKEGIDDFYIKNADDESIRWINGQLLYYPGEYPDINKYEHNPSEEGFFLLMDDVLNKRIIDITEIQNSFYTYYDYAKNKNFTREYDFDIDHPIYALIEEIQNNDISTHPFDHYIIMIYNPIINKISNYKNEFLLKRGDMLKWMNKLLKDIYVLFSTHNSPDTDEKFINFYKIVDYVDETYSKLIENDTINTYGEMLNAFRSFNQENKTNYISVQSVTRYAITNFPPIRSIELKNIILFTKGQIYLKNYQLIKDYRDSMEIYYRLTNNQTTKPQYTQIFKNNLDEINRYFSLIFSYEKKIPTGFSYLSPRYQQIENTLSSFENIRHTIDDKIRSFRDNTINIKLIQYNNLSLFPVIDQYPKDIDNFANEIYSWCKMTFSIIDLIKTIIKEKYDSYLKNFKEMNIYIETLNKLFEYLLEEKNRLTGEKINNFDELPIEKILILTEKFISLFLDYGKSQDTFNEKKDLYILSIQDYLEIILQKNKEFYIALKKCYIDVNNILKSLNSNNFNSIVIKYAINAQFWINFNELNKRILREQSYHENILYSIENIENEINTTYSYNELKKMNIMNNKGIDIFQINDILVNEKTLIIKYKNIQESITFLINIIDSLKQWIIIRDFIIKKNTLQNLEKILGFIYSNEKKEDRLLLKETKSYIKILNSVNQRLTDQILDTDHYLLNSIEDNKKIEKKLIKIEKIIHDILLFEFTFEEIQKLFKNISNIKEIQYLFDFTKLNEEPITNIMKSINKNEDIKKLTDSYANILREYNQKKFTQKDIVMIIKTITDFYIKPSDIKNDLPKLSNFLDYIKNETVNYFTNKYTDELINLIDFKGKNLEKILILVNDYIVYYNLTQSIDVYEKKLNEDTKLLNEKFLEQLLNIYSPYLKFKKLLDEQIKIKNEKKEELKTQIDLLINEFNTEKPGKKEFVKITYDLDSYKQLTKDIDNFIKNDIPVYKKKIYEKYQSSYKEIGKWRTSILEKDDGIDIPIKDYEEFFILMKDEYLALLDTENQAIILSTEYKNLKKEKLSLINENQTYLTKKTEISANNEILFSILQDTGDEININDVKNQIEYIKFYEDNKKILQKNTNEKENYIKNKKIIDTNIIKLKKDIELFNKNIINFINQLNEKIKDSLEKNHKELDNFYKSIEESLRILDREISSLGGDEPMEQKEFNYKECFIEFTKLTHLKIKIKELIKIYSESINEKDFIKTARILIKLSNGLKENKITQTKIDKLSIDGRKRFKYYKNYESWKLVHLNDQEFKDTELKINKGEKIVNESNTIEGLAIRTQKRAYFNTSLITYNKLKDFIEKNRKKYETFKEQFTTHSNNIKSNTIDLNTLCTYDIKELNQYTKKTNDLMDEIRKFQNEVSGFISSLNNIDTFISSFQNAFKYEIDNLIKIDKQYADFFFDFIYDLPNLEDTNHEIKNKRNELLKDAKRIYQKRADYLTVDILKKLNSEEISNNNKVQILLNIVENLLTNFNEYQKRKIEIQKDITKFKLQEERNKKKENIINITNNKPPTSELLLLLSLIKNRDLKKDEEDITYYIDLMTNMSVDMEGYSKMNDIPSGKFNFFDNTKKNYAEFIKFIEKELLRAKKSLLNNKKYTIIESKGESSGKLTESMINDFSNYGDNMIKINMFHTNSGKILTDKKVFLDKLIDNSAILFFTYVKNEYDELKELSKDDKIGEEKLEKVTNLVKKLDFLKENETIKLYVEGAQTKNELILNILKYSQTILENPSAKDIKKESIEYKRIKEEQSEWDVLYKLLEDYIERFEEHYNNFDTLYKELTNADKTLSNYSDIKKIPQNNEKFYFFTKNTLIDMEKIYVDSFKRIDKWMKLNRKLKHIFYDISLKDQPKRPSINILEDIHLYISEINYFFPTGVDDSFTNRLDKQRINFIKLFTRETITYLNIVQKEREDIDKLINDIPVKDKENKDISDIISQINDIKTNISLIFTSVTMIRTNPQKEINDLLDFYKDNPKKFIVLIVENYNFYSQNLTKIIKQKILEVKKKTKNEGTWNNIKRKLNDQDLKNTLQHMETDYDTIEQIILSFRIYDKIINYLPKNKFQLFDITKNRYTILIKDKEKDIIRYEKMITNLKEIIDSLEQSDLMDTPPNQLLNKVENFKKDQQYFNDYTKNLQEDINEFVNNIFFNDVKSLFKFLNKEEDEILQLYFDIPDDIDDSKKYENLKTELLLYRSDIMFFIGGEMDVEKITKKEKHVNDYDEYISGINHRRLQEDIYYQEIITDMINHVTKLVEKSLSEFQKKLNEFKKRDKEEIKENQITIYDKHLENNEKEAKEILDYFETIFKKIDFIKQINLKTIKDSILKKKIELINNFKETTNYKSPKSKIPIHDVLNSIKQLYFYIKPTGSTVSIVSKSDKSLADMKNIKYYFDQDLTKLLTIINDIYRKFYREPKTPKGLVIYHRNNTDDIPQLINNFKEDINYIYILPMNDNVYFFPIFYIFIINKNESRNAKDFILDIKYEFSLKNDNNFIRKIHVKDLPKSIKIVNKNPYSILNEFDKYDFKEIGKTLDFIEKTLKKEKSNPNDMIDELFKLYKTKKSALFLGKKVELLPEISEPLTIYQLRDNHKIFSNYVKKVPIFEKYIVRFKNFNNNILKNDIKIKDDSSRKIFIDLLIIYLSIQGTDQYDLTIFGIYALELIQYILNISQYFKVDTKDDNNIFSFIDLNRDFKNYLFLPNAFEYYYFDFNPNNLVIIEYVTCFPETKYLNPHLNKLPKFKIYDVSPHQTKGDLVENYDYSKLNWIYGTTKDGNSKIIEGKTYTKQFIVDKHDTLWIKIDDIYQPMSFFGDIGKKENKIIENDIKFVCFVKQ